METVVVDLVVFQDLSSACSYCGPLAIVSVHLYGTLLPFCNLISGWMILPGRNGLPGRESAFRRVKWYLWGFTQDASEPDKFLLLQSEH